MLALHGLGVTADQLTIPSETSRSRDLAPGQLSTVMERRGPGLGQRPDPWKLAAPPSVRMTTSPVAVVPHTIHG